MCEVTEGDGYAISIRGLRKEYRSRSGTAVAVAGLDLDVPAGGVFGFLGPNGAGKTTLRMFHARASNATTKDIMAMLMANCSPVVKLFTVCKGYPSDSRHLRVATASRIIISTGSCLAHGSRYATEGSS